MFYIHTLPLLSYNLIVPFFFLVLNMNNWVSNVLFLQVITNVTTRAGVFSHSFASVLLLRRITDWLRSHWWQVSRVSSFYWHEECVRTVAVALCPVCLWHIFGHFAKVYCPYLCSGGETTSRSAFTVGEWIMLDGCCYAEAAHVRVHGCGVSQLWSSKVWLSKSLLRDGEGI